jgi:hypothetical protein
MPLPVIPVVASGLVRGLIWIVLAIVAGYFELYSRGWQMFRGFADDLLGQVQVAINSISTFVPMMPDTTEIEKVAYTIEQAGFDLRMYWTCLVGYATFYLALLAWRYTYAAIRFIKGL